MGLRLSRQNKTELRSYGGGNEDVYLSQKSMDTQHSLRAPNLSRYCWPTSDEELQFLTVVWVSLCQSGSFLLVWCKQSFVCVLSLFSQSVSSYVSSGGSIVGLMVTSSRAYAHTSLLHQSPACCSGGVLTCYLHRRHAGQVCSVSVGSLGAQGLLSPLGISQWYGA